MSNTAVTLAGETLIAQRIAAGTPLVIDRIIVANVPELDPDLAVDRTEGMPDAASIVHDYAIPEEFKGYVNPNQVVYSLLLGSDIGDFSFNWLGLYASADGVMVAVTHLPATNKWQTDIATNTLGNNLTRNFMLEFSGAQDLTGITVQAATWQVDFTVRLAGIDARERQSNRDVYGRALFWGDGFKVANTGNLTLQAGIGYVEGIRAVNAALLTVSAAVTGRDVWLDVSLQGQGSDVVPIISPVVVATGAMQADYVDADNAPHYLVPLASVDGAGAVTDLRTTEAIADNVVAWLAAHPKRQDNPHNVTYAQTGAAPLNHTHVELRDYTLQLSDPTVAERGTVDLTVVEVSRWPIELVPRITLQDDTDVTSLFTATSIDNGLRLTAPVVEDDTAYKVFAEVWEHGLMRSPEIGPLALTVKDAPVNTPVVLLPADGATDVIETPTITTSAFSSDEGQTHAGTRVQIATGASFASMVHDSGEIGAVTEYAVPSGVLAEAVLYHVRAAHKGSGGDWSSWSAANGFTTMDQFCNAHKWDSWDETDEAALACDDIFVAVMENTQAGGNELGQGGGLNETVRTLTQSNNIAGATGNPPARLVDGAKKFTVDGGTLALVSASAGAMWTVIIRHDVIFPTDNNTNIGWMQNADYSRRLYSESGTEGYRPAVMGSGGSAMPVKYPTGGGYWCWWCDGISVYCGWCVTKPTKLSDFAAGYAINATDAGKAMPADYAGISFINFPLPYGLNRNTTEYLHFLVVSRLCLIDTNA